MIKTTWKFLLVAPKREKEKIINFFYQKGKVELEGKKEETEKISELEEKLKKALEALEILGLSKKEKKIEISLKEAEKIEKEFNLEKFFYRLKELIKEKEKLIAEKESILEEKTKLFSWKEFDFSSREGQYTIARIYSIPNKKIEEISFLKEKGIFKILTQEKKETIILVILLKKDENLFEKIKEKGAQEIKFSFSPKRRWQVLDQREREIDSKIKEIEKEIEEFKKEKNKLKILYDFWTIKKDILLAKERAKNFNLTFCLEGWVKKEDFSTLKKEVERKFPGAYMKKLNVKREEEVPVFLENSKIFAPFEAITRFYGLPKPGNPDPTPFFAPFFAISFAFCLTDAAYGIILSLLLFFLILWKKPKGEIGKFMKVFLFSAIATVILGALFGGWFGIDLSKYSQNPVISFLKKFQKIDPMNTPLLVLGLAIGLGVLQLLFGTAVRGVWAIIQKDKKEAVSKFAWVFLFVFLFLFAYSKTKSDSGVDIFEKLFYGYLLVFVGAQIWAQKTKNIFAKVFGGVGSLYGIINYFSDFLSFSRLMALGLSTAIVALAVNLIAQVFKDLLPGILGFIAFFAILIVGHIFNIGMNCLSAFVHTLRLQFVEFFPKFTEAGGREFKPLSPNLKFVRVSDFKKVRKKVINQK